MKKTAKIATILLSLAFLITAFVLTIGAEEANDGYVAEVNGIKYENFCEQVEGNVNISGGALKAAEASGTTLKLLADVSTAGQISTTANQSYTIDLNGHTLTVKGLIYGRNGTLTFKGNGTIVVDKSEASDKRFIETVGNLNLLGDNKGITIKCDYAGEANFIGVIGNSKTLTVNNTVFEVPNWSTNIFYLKDIGNSNFNNVKMTIGGTINNKSTNPMVIKNSEITSTGTAHVISLDPSAELDMAGVKIIATVGTDNTKAAINIAGAPKSINLNYCSIYTAKMPAFISANGIDPSLTINNSKIVISSGTLIGGSSNLTGTVDINNSYVEYGVKMATTGSNYVFKDSTIALNAQGEVVRNGNLELQGNTTVISTVNKYAKLSMNDSSKVQFGIGTRFDINAYDYCKELVTAKGYQISYDKSNPDAPYIVVAANADTVPLPDEYLYSNLNSATPYGAATDTTNGTYEEGTVNGKNYWNFTSNVNTTVSSSTYFYYGTNALSANAYPLLVFDFDISAKDSTNFIAGGLALNSRLNSSSGTNKTVAFASVAKDGTVKISNGTSVATAKIAKGEWNHITAIVDTTKTSDNCYVYVNGTYIGVSKASNGSESEYTDGSLKFFGIRYDFASKVYEQNTSIAMSGLDARGYNTAGDFSDNGASYLTNGGLIYYTEDTSCGITIADAPVSDLNTAIKLNSDLGLIAQLNKNIENPGQVTEAGFIKANGYSIGETDYGSLPFELIDGFYEFHTRIYGLKVNVSVYSDFGVNIYIPAEYDINEAFVGEDSYLDSILQCEANGISYNKITVFKKAYKASENIDLTLKLTVNGYAHEAKTTTINVISYASKVLDRYAENSTESKFMYYILNYAQEAGKYYEGKISGAAPNSTISELIKNANLNHYDYNSEKITSRTDEEIQAMENSDIKCAIDIDSDKLGYIFTVNNKAYADKVTVILAGKTYKSTTGIIKIEGLKVYNLVQEIIINIDGVECKYNLATFVDSYRAPDSTLSEEDKTALSEAADLVEAFYNYAKCASEYKTETSQTDENVTKLNILSGKQAIYSNNIEYIAGTSTSIALGDNEIFSISDNGMKLCNATVKGDYNPGNYSLKAYIAPEQNIMYVEVELPDGGIVRRGNSETLGSNLIQVFSENEDIGKGSVTYSDISKNSYELVSTEPVNGALESKFYNLVTSFDDACTTRYFAWTANASYIGTSEMALKYRESGTDTWYSVDAQRQEEASTVAAEDYFKAELTGLSPETVYEYQIGIKNSETDWGIIHTFETAPEIVSDFKFVAIGDTQSFYWDGDTVSDKGYKYAMAAIEEAVQDAGNPAFILHTGDITDTSSRLAEWNWYFKALGSYAASIPHFAAIGNHDIRTNDQNNYFSLHLNHPDNGKNAMDEAIASGVTGAYGKVMVSSYDDTIYSYDYGNAHFIVLNSGVDDINDDECIYNAQRAWLEADLQANADADWIIVMTHDAVYNQASGTNNRQYLSDLIEAYGVDLVIQGHSHLVTRTYPMKNGQIVTKANADTITKGSGTVYTTIGSTTLSHTAISDPNAEECLTAITPHSNQPTYAVVSVEGNELIVTVKQINGYVLDSFSIIFEE